MLSLQLPLSRHCLTPCWVVCYLTPDLFLQQLLAMKYVSTHPWWLLLKVGNVFSCNCHCCSSPVCIAASSQVPHHPQPQDRVFPLNNSGARGQLLFSRSVDTKNGVTVKRTHYFSKKSALYVPLTIIFLLAICISHF